MQLRIALTALAIVAALGSHADPSCGQPASPADATAQARALFAEQWQWTLREFPEFATFLGDHRYDDRLSDQSAAAVLRRRAARAGFLERADKIDIAGLDAADRVSLRIFRYQLEQAAALDKLCAPVSCTFDGFWSPVTQFDGPQFSVPQLVQATRFASVRDYDAYLKRLDAVGIQLDQLIMRMQTGMKLGWMPAKIAIARVPGQLDAQLDPDPVKNPEYAPFQKFPADVSPADRERLAAAGRQMIKDKVIPAFQRLRDFYEKRYLPAASTSIAASSLPP